MVTGRIIVEGAGTGELLRLSAPISFWGGVAPVAGVIADPRHPEHGASIAGKVLAVPSAVGSSSSSAIMLELIREETAPAALLLGSADAIVFSPRGRVANPGTDFVADGGWIAIRLLNQQAARRGIDDSMQVMVNRVGNVNLVSSLGAGATSAGAAQ